MLPYRHGFCRRRHFGALQQDIATIIHPANLQLCLKLSSNLWTRSLSPPSDASVRCIMPSSPWTLKSLFARRHEDDASILVAPSSFKFSDPPSRIGSAILTVLGQFGLVRLTRDAKSNAITSTSNLTLLNAILIIRGPMTEKQLTIECIYLQVAGSVLAFGVRYGLAGVFYDGDRR